MWSNSNSQIDTLHVHTNGADRATLLRAMASMLSRAELRPGSMPPAAVLFVRRMPDPLPQRLAAGSPTARLDPGWERALQNALAEQYRRAIRPQQGRINPAAEAVCFADHSEMLACLLMDLPGGRAWQRWWWRVPLRDLPQHPGDALAVCMDQNARFLPAVLAQLAGWGQASAVLRQLVPLQALRILRALLEAFALADFTSLPPAAMLEQSSAEMRPDSPEPPVLPSVPADPVSRSARPPHQSARRSWLSAIAAGADLAPAQQALLGMGVLLFQQPALTRSPDFQQFLHIWWALPVAAGMPDSIVPQQPDQHRHPARQLPVPEHERPAATEPSAATVDAGLEQRSCGANRATAGTGAVARAHESAQPVPADPQHSRRLDPNAFEAPTAEILPAAAGTDELLPPTEPEPTPASAAASDVPAEQAGSGSTAFEAVAADQIPGDKDKTRSWTLEAGTTALAFAEGVTTRLGGLLFLINLMRHLDLPACFEPEWPLAGEPGSWGVLELLGRALLPREPALETDPLWDALAMLAGREPGHMPGSSFRGGASLQLPASWPLHLSSGSHCFWAADTQYCWLWTDAGYGLLAAPYNDRVPRELVETSLRSYHSAQVEPVLLQQPVTAVPRYSLAGSLADGLAPDLAGWLGFVMPYLRFRLLQALRIADMASLVGLLLLQSGQLYVTATHVDLVLSLENIVLPVRMAGLDSNPGWLADFGRVVLFHFQ